MSLESPKCSVLISTFNRPDYLREAIQSVVDQMFTDWELLIMNDGGVDVAHVIDEFNDQRIRYFPDDKNRGAAHRFNIGLENCRGEYVTYLGDDDIFYPNHLEVLSKALDENPEAGLAYSDLYAVSCVKDEKTGKRFVLDKKIMVSRDFNRAFMFHYNHVLHVSLMHRREAAFRVGCFDESVKVLIEWSLNRRLCFHYDFVHVPVPTGEYYMPVFKSDRISVVQRKDKNSYKHNVRKIRTTNPPGPWKFIDKLAIVYPVYNGGEQTSEKVADVIDEIDHPFDLYLINNTGRPEADLVQDLGKIAELKAVNILTPSKRLPPLESYRYGAKHTNAEYLFLITDNLKVKDVPKRIFSGLEMLKQMDGKNDGIKWSIEEEKNTPFDLLIRKDLFLKKSDLKKKDNELHVQTLNHVMAMGFKFDVLFAEHKRQHSKGDFDDARKSLEECLALGKGAPGDQFLIHNYHKTLMTMEDYETLEPMLRNLISRGYVPDNAIRLGQVLQATGRYQEAIESYKTGLAEHYWDKIDFDSDLFPFNFPKELAAFHALLGLGECYYETGEAALASKMFHQASKMRANSHKPFLGFAKLFLAANQLDRAEVVLSKIGPRDGAKDPATQRLMGRLCERRRRMDLAFDCYAKAFDLGPHDERNIDPFYYCGAGLRKWDDMKPALERFLEKRTGHVKAISRLASICLQTEEYRLAQDLTRQGLACDPTNAVLRSIERRLSGMEIPEPEIRETVQPAFKLEIPGPFTIGHQGQG